jgi:hypothetical protein
MTIPQAAPIQPHEWYTGSSGPLSDPNLKCHATIWTISVATGVQQQALLNHAVDFKRYIKPDIACPLLSRRPFRRDWYALPGFGKVTIRVNAIPSRPTLPTPASSRPLRPRIVNRNRCGDSP